MKPGELNGTTSLPSNVLEINCMGLIANASASGAGAGTGTGSLYQYLQGLYTWYTVFGEEKWDIFKKWASGDQSQPLGFSVFIPQYDTTNKITLLSIQTGSDLQKYLGYASTNLLFNVSRSSVFNPFVARRMMYLWILVTNILIAIQGSTTTGSSDQADYQNLVKACYSLLVNANLNVSYNTNASNNVSTGGTGTGGGASPDSLNMTPLGAINQAVGSSIRTYNAGVGQIDSVNSHINTQKININNVQQLISQRQALQKKQRIYEYVAMAVMIAIATGASIAIVMPMENSKKMMICGCIVVVSIINFFALGAVIKNTTVETFAYSANPDINASVDTLTSDLSNTADYINVIKDQISLYIDNTINLTVLLETYRAYNNVNFSMQKEIAYYTEASQDLASTLINTNNYYDLSFMQQVKYSSLLNLFKSLGLIIAGVATAYIALEGTQSMQTTVCVIGFILAVVSLVIYIMEITSHVHTKTHTYYWNNPDKKKFN
jgi:hypothetical protein